ncbi:hypothetical protein JOM56_013003 [Amanita muscaria]
MASAILLSTPDGSIPYNSTLNITFNRLAPQLFSLSFDPFDLPQDVQLPENIPLKITVSLPEEICTYVRPIICIEPTKMSDVESSHSLDDPLMDISFLPLPRNFDYAQSECWKPVVNKISHWLTSIVVDQSTPEWLWGREAFWMAYFAAYPTFPGGQWPNWNADIALDGPFAQSWLDGHFQTHDLEAFYLDVWQQFQQHVSLFCPQLLTCQE